MKKDTRLLARCFNVRVKGCSSSEEGPEVTFEGRNSAGKEAAFTVRLPWWIWPLLVKEMAKAWLHVRAMRLREIETIDKTLKEAA